MSLDERDDSFITWGFCMMFAFQTVGFTFLLIKDRCPTYMQTFINSPLTGPVGFVFLLGVTLTYMSAWPELWTLVFMIAWISVHVTWRKKIYPLKELTISGECWYWIVVCHIGTNVIFGVILGICVGYNIKFNWLMFVLFFFLSTALAMNESIRCEKNVWSYARHMVYHSIMCSNMIWYNQNVEDTLFRMYRKPWSQYEFKHDPFITTPSICINGLVALITAINCVEWNALTISKYVVLPFLVSLLVWSWDFGKGFWKGLDWKWNITMFFFCFVLVCVFLEPNVTCNINYGKEYVVSNYKFNVSTNNGFQTKDVSFNVIVGPTFRDVTMVAYGTGDVESFKKQFDNDKRVILAYKILRKQDIGCALQLEWRVKFSWIPRLPVLKTGEEWSFSWLNVVGTPTRLILRFELNRAEEVERLKQDIESLKKENNKNKKKLEQLRPCETNLGNCKTEEARLKPLETNVTTMLQTINNHGQDDQNPVTVENLAAKYRNLVQKNTDLEEQIPTKDSEIQNLTREDNKKQETLSGIERALHGLEERTPGTIIEQVESLIRSNVYCEGQLGLKERQYGGCQSRSSLCQHHLGVLNNLTQTNNTVESLAKVQSVFATVSEYKSELDKCNANKITGWCFMTPNTSETHTNGKQEAKTPTIGKNEANFHTNGKKEAEKQAHLLKEQAKKAQLAAEEAEQAKKAQLAAEEAEQAKKAEKQAQFEQAKKAESLATADALAVALGGF